MISSVRKNPNLWKFIENIRDEEETQVLRKIRLETSILRERCRNKQDLQRDLLIAKMKNLLIEKKINLKDYMLELGEKVVKNYNN